MANGSNTLDVLLLAIVARLISQIDGTQGASSGTGVLTADAASGQPIVFTNLGTTPIGSRLLLGTAGTREVHTVSSSGALSLTLADNLLFSHSNGSAVSYYAAGSPVVTADNCFITIDPGAEPPVNAGDRSIAVICEGGSFDQGLLEGGGEQQAGIELSIATRVYSPSQLDVPRQDAQMLTNSAVGVMGMVTNILKALTNWSPLDGNSSRLTRDPLLPVATAVSKDGRRIAWFEVQWRVFFDWDLTSATP